MTNEERRTNRKSFRSVFSLTRKRNWLNIGLGMLGMGVGMMLAIGDPSWLNKGLAGAVVLVSLVILLQGIGCKNKPCKKH